MVENIRPPSCHLKPHHRVLLPFQQLLNFFDTMLHRCIVPMLHHLLNPRRIRVLTSLSVVHLCRYPSDSSITDQLTVHGLSLAPSQSREYEQLP